MKKICVVLGVVSVSLSAIFVRMTDTPSLVLTLYRTLAAALMLLPAVLFKHKEELKSLTKKELGLCLISGVFLGLHFTAYFESLRYTSIASSVVLVDTEVFFVAFAMGVFFQEKISKKGWAGILLAFLGSILVATADVSGQSGALLGDAIALLGAAFMAVYTMIGKVARQNISTTVYTFLVYLASAVTVLCILLPMKTPLTGYGTSSIVSGLGMAVFCTLLGHSVYSWALKYETPSFISTAKLLEPVFASILGVIIFSEMPGKRVVLGGICIILGIYGYARFGERKEEKQIQC